MMPVKVRIAALGLMALASALLLVQVGDRFLPFGTLYVPDAFYGSGNIYLAGDASVAWVILLVSVAALAARVTRGSLTDDFDQWLLQPSPRRFVTLACLWIFLVAQLISWLVFDHHPRDVDHVARIFQAKVFASGQLTVEAPPYPEFFQVFAVLVHNGEMFSKYAPGGALFFLIPELIAGTSMYINPLLGTLAAACLYLGARNWFSERVARLSLIFAALSPWFVFMAGSLHSHVPAMFLFTLIFYLFSRVKADQGFCACLVFAGFAGGLFVATREYTSLLICSPLVLYLLARDPPRAPGRLLALVTGVAIPALCLLLYNKRLTGDALLFPHLLADPEQVPWFGYKGHTIRQGAVHLWESVRLININLLGWPVAWLLVLFYLPVRSAGSNVLAACFLTLAAGYFANYWNDYSLGARYYFEAAPALFILAALGFWYLYDRAESDSLVLNRRMLLCLLPLAYCFGAMVYLPRLVPIYANQYNGNVYTRVSEQARTLGDQNILVFCTDADGENGGYASGFLNNPLNLAEISRMAMTGKSQTDPRPIFARDLGGKNQLLMSAFPDRNYYTYRYFPERNQGEFSRINP